MKYFSGYCLKNEYPLFDEYLIKTDFNVAGFSYGAIKACEAALTCKERVDTLQLISPAFFNDKSESFKNIQIKLFEKDAIKYADGFLQNAFSHENNKDKIREYLAYGTKEQLEELLFYEWQESLLQEVVDKNIKIEVYIGGIDKIINPIATKDFFMPFADVYFFKQKDHFLF